MVRIFKKYQKNIVLFILMFIGIGINSFAMSDAKNINKKVLVVYYSATGTTEGVAKIIAEETNGDLFKLEPKIPYTEADLNWRDKNSRVVREHENIDKIHVELKDTKVDNFDSYDTIFIGSPIWWREAAWVIYDFVKDNDFTGKTVILFGTSITTGMGDSLKKLEKLAGTGEWKTDKRFSSAYDRDEIIKWVKRQINN